MANVRGYVLAGGRSSRMGLDKAEMCLGGLTLLEIAVAKLRPVCCEVVVVGDRQHLPEGVRVLPDLRPGCGPIGGVAAALRDVGTGSAMFLPVDMPLLPGVLLEQIAEVWFQSGAAVCLLVADGQMQPLVSLVRATASGEMEAALERGAYKVRPALEAAGQRHGGVLRTEISTRERALVWPGWMPGDREWAARGLWFANLNTPEEFASAEMLARQDLGGMISNSPHPAF